jgi:hypothetical protein
MITKLTPKKPRKGAKDWTMPESSRQRNETLYSKAENITLMNSPLPLLVAPFQPPSSPFLPSYTGKPATSALMNKLQGKAGNFF